MTTKINCLNTSPFIDVDQKTFDHDNFIYKKMRENINEAIMSINLQNIKSVLEIGPSNDITKTFKHLRNLDSDIIYHTLDIIQNDNITYVGDITKSLDHIKHTYDLILLCEVIEHTNNPFSAIQNVASLLNDNGKILITFPFNFRIHGPLPDCWRISEFGFKSIINTTTLKISKLDALIMNERPYFPLHYVAIVTKDIM